MNAVLKYLEEEPAEEKNVELNVVTHSSGNFAQALALAAHALTSPEKSIKATIIMARTGSPAKRAGVAGYGARIVDCEPDNRVETCEEEIQRVSWSFIRIECACENLCVNEHRCEPKAEKLPICRLMTMWTSSRGKEHA
jgi:threonine dehydratase